MARLRRGRRNCSMRQMLRSFFDVVMCFLRPGVREEILRLRGENRSQQEELQHVRDEHSERVRELEEHQRRRDLDSKRIRELEHACKSEANRLANLLQGESREKTAAQEELQLMESVKQELERKVDALEKEIAEESFGGSYSDSSATPTAFEAALAHTNEALQNFSSALVLSCPDIYFPATFAGSVFARKLHWKFALQSQLSKVMFANFELEGFGVDHHTENMDAKEFRERCFEEYKLCLHGNEPELVRQAKVTEFAREKAGKVCEVLQRDVFGNSQGKLKQELLQKFYKVVISVWRLHKLAFSFYPAARMLHVCGGMKMNDEYMESALSADDVDEDEFAYDEGKVGFAISPGFTIRKSVFKCQVYPALLRKSSELC